MALRGSELFCTFTVMGGFMQPQGHVQAMSNLVDFGITLTSTLPRNPTSNSNRHVQVMSNLLDFGMTPQAALDAPRFCIADGTSGGAVSFEEGVEEGAVETLVGMGHKVSCPRILTGHARALFGRGQIILRDPTDGVLCGGSDPRADGCAMGWCGVVPTLSSA